MKTCGLNREVATRIGGDGMAGKLTDTEITTWLSGRFSLAIEEGKAKPAVLVLAANGVLRAWDEIDAAEAMRELTRPRAGRPKGYDVRPIQFRRALIAAAGGRQAWLAIARTYPAVMAWLASWEGIEARRSEIEGVSRLWGKDDTARACDAWRRESAGGEEIRAAVMAACILAHAWRMMTGEAIEAERSAAPPPPAQKPPTPAKGKGPLMAGVLRAREFIRSRCKVALDRQARRVMFLTGRAWKPWTEKQTRHVAEELRKQGGAVETSDICQALEIEARSADYAAMIEAGREEVRRVLREGRVLGLDGSRSVFVLDDGSWRRWRPEDSARLLDLLRVLQCPAGFDLEEIAIMRLLAEVAEERGSRISAGWSRPASPGEASACDENAGKPSARS